ncbi:MAG TPA: hypothetical protein VJA66_00110 [Thermoanaerobaculia bacterium]
MPKQKDLKRIIRSRMEKTGEAYTAARLHVLRKNQPAPDYAKAAGMSDAAVSKATGRAWSQWVGLLDSNRSAERPHREIVKLVSSQGIADWWSQMVTVGYERIRGLRERGQRRGGGYEASKSRTFPVSVDVLFEAWANARKRKKWLPVKITVRSATPHKYMRIRWSDDTPVQVGFLPKGGAKSSVAIQHEKLPSKSAAEEMKKVWSEHFDRLGQVLG